MGSEIIGSTMEIDEKGVLKVGDAKRIPKDKDTLVLGESKDIGEGVTFRLEGIKRNLGKEKENKEESR